MGKIKVGDIVYRPHDGNKYIVSFIDKGHCPPQYVLQRIDNRFFRVSGGLVKCSSGLFSSFMRFVGFSKL